MNIIRDADAKTFLDKSRALLYAREAEYGLLIGLAESLLTFLKPAIQPVFMRAEHNGRTTAVLLQTRIESVAMSHATPEETKAFAQAARAGGVITRGISAPHDVADLFCRTYFAGQPFEVLQDNKILVLTKVTPPARPAAGQMRLAGKQDLDTTVRFLTEFLPEALPKEPVPPREEIVKVAQGKLDRKTVYLWEVDGVPVCTAHSSRPTANGICIAAVYTPRPQRGKGYCSSLMAELSQHLLDEGRKFVCLYTDAENPTSNKVYEGVGYQAIGTAALMGVRAQS